MTGPLRLAVAGTGYFSQFHFDAWRRCPEVTIVAVASQDEAAARAAAEPSGAACYTDAETMIAQVDADLVDIITPPNTHHALLIACAERGITSVCQKPFCGDLATAQRAVQALKAANSRCIVHENFRFQPWYAQVHDILASKKLGTIYQAQFRLRPGDGQGPDAYLARQPYFQTMERFLVHETAVHFIDVFRYLFGPMDHVWADLRRLNPVIAGEDDGLLVLRHTGGVRTLIDGNRLADHAAENPRRTMGELMIDAEHGELRLDGDAALWIRQRGSARWQRVDYSWNDHGFGGDCVYRFTRHVVDHLISGAPVMTAAEDYLTNLAVEEAVYASAADGKARTL